MRLPLAVVAELAWLLEQPDPSDLVTRTGARRGHVRTVAGDPARRVQLLLNLSLAMLPRARAPTRRLRDLKGV